MKSSLEIRQTKLRHWAGIIHECQNSGISTKEWLFQRGISKDTYYYWYKRVRSACAEAVEASLPVAAPTFVELPAPGGRPVITPQPIQVVTMRIGSASIDIPETVSESLLRKLIGVVTDAE